MKLASQFKLLDLRLKQASEKINEVQVTAEESLTTKTSTLEQ